MSEDKIKEDINADNKISEDRINNDNISEIKINDDKLSMENKRQNVWLYAVVLFISAFIVLLFTAYSQIKLNKNLENYKNKVYSTENEKQMYQQHFASAQEMNEELNLRIEELEEKIEEMNQEMTELKQEKNDLELESIRKSAANRLLSEALVLYMEGEPAKAFDLLEKIEPENLDEASVNAYDMLKRKAGSEAGSILFDEGYDLYRKGKYEEAVSAFERSYSYASDEEFSDKCLYYKAYAELKTNNRTSAVETMKLLISKFQESNYLSRAKKFVSRYEK